MENIISEYQRWKQQGASIRTQARQAMEAKFRDLLTEAAEISQEYYADFGVALKPPPSITAFKFKASGKAAKPTAKGAVKKVAAAVPVKEPAAAPPSAKVVALEKKLALAKKKLEGAKTAGTATRNLEDRIYEIEDEIRLATSAS